MAPRERSRSSNAAQANASQAASARRSPDPVLRLQAKIGNRAAGQVLAREPETKREGTIRLGKLPEITIVGGNVKDWAAKKDVDTLEVISEKGKHSAELEKLSSGRSTIKTVKVTAPMVDPGGKHLDFGSVEIEFVDARIARYKVDGKLESWRVADFKSAHRTTISRKSGI